MTYFLFFVATLAALLILRLPKIGDWHVFEPTGGDAMMRRWNNGVWEYRQFNEGERNEYSLSVW